MKTNSIHANPTGWPLPWPPEPEWDFNLLNEMSENEEYNFYSFPDKKIIRRREVKQAVKTIPGAGK